MRQSEPHQIRPNMGKIFLQPSSAKDKAQKVLKILRSGKDVDIDSLEVLDEILNSISPLEESCILVEASNGEFDMSVLRRLRFRRGLDVRPRAYSE